MQSGRTSRLERRLVPRACIGSFSHVIVSPDRVTLHFVVQVARKKKSKEIYKRWLLVIDRLIIRHKVAGTW